MRWPLAFSLAYRDRFGKAPFTTRDVTRLFDKSKHYCRGNLASSLRPGNLWLVILLERCLLLLTRDRFGKGPFPKWNATRSLDLSNHSCHEESSYDSGLRPAKF